MKRAWGWEIASAYKCYDSVVSSKWIRWNYKFCECLCLFERWRVSEANEHELSRQLTSKNLRYFTIRRRMHPENTAFILNRRIATEKQKQQKNIQMGKDMDKVNHFVKLAHSVLCEGLLPGFSILLHSFAHLHLSISQLAFSVRLFRHSH